jgi:hypothetical protein
MDHVVRQVIWVAICNALIFEKNRTLWGYMFKKIIICCIHAITYFSWSDEVLMYFIVRVEVVEIQIWFEFKLICNL